MYNIYSPNDCLVYMILVILIDESKSCNTELLGLRRIHIDLIMLHKILNGLICVNIDICLTFSLSNNWGNVCKLVKNYSKLDIRKYFFALGVFDISNSLPDDIICFINVKQFTSKLDLSHFLRGMQGKQSKLI